MTQTIKILSFKFFKFKTKLISIQPIYYLILVSSIALYLRVLYINHEFWLDELTSCWVIDEGFSEIFKRCWINNLSPLFYITIYTAKICTGYTEYSLRLPGIIFGVLTIPLIYLLSFKLSKSKTLSIIGAFLASIDKSLIYNSMEVRPYALVIFFTLLSIYIFLFYLERAKKLSLAIVLGLLNGIIILLHYTAVTICIVEFIIALAYFFINKNYSRSVIYSLFAYTIIPIIMLLPFLNHFIYLFDNNYILGNWIKKENLSVIFTLHSQLTNYILFPLVIIFFIAYFISKDLFINKFDKFILFFLISWYFIPQSIFWFLTEANFATIFSPRYLVLVIPAPIIGSVVFASNLRNSKIRWIYFISIIILSTKLYNPSILIKPSKYIDSRIISASSFNWKNAVTTINNSRIKPDRIFVLSNLVEAAKLKEKNNDPLLKKYLLSTVNSLYKLRNDLLEKTEPIKSISDIPDSLSNYLIILEESELDFHNNTSLLNTIKISPKGAKVTIFYKSCQIKSK